ncbi:hypothetical protein VCRA2126O85_50154 [Vibrio crassostreae]|nr:hypothetical protein VCRA2125O83_50154 [Vibrio crassostreae]CAK3037727.1 hypothetical protein VCRA2126O86_50153 [Vibrio crassostreae]CAK3038032.1 hypothetical protein VCRA2128O106_50154 [Vibrio crassostreae]CAK3040215.1 hypothetical protein VCRA2127O91_50154 [Vibrio crassostreae]CAK3040420.1 hypothetical protein VCRA2126O85_50154 [Vibrio crassostreae]
MKFNISSPNIDPIKNPTIVSYIKTKNIIKINDIYIINALILVDFFDLDRKCQVLLPQYHSK